MDCSNDYEIAQALQQNEAKEQLARRIWAWNQFNDLSMSFSCAGGDYCKCQSAYVDVSSSPVRIPVYKCPAKSMTPMGESMHVKFMDDEKKLLNDRTRQQYHNDNLKAATPLISKEQKAANTQRALANIQARMHAIQFDLGP